MSINSIVTDLNSIAADRLVCCGITVNTPEARDLLRAISIADSCARADVECSSHWQDIDGVRWHDITPALDPDKDAPELIAEFQASVDHLAARGLLVRDAANPTLVSFKTEAS